jgi:hypothetical protein
MQHLDTGTLVSVHQSRYTSTGGLVRCDRHRTRLELLCQVDNASILNPRQQWRPRFDVLLLPITLARAASKYEPYATPWLKVHQHQMSRRWVHVSPDQLDVCHYRTHWRTRSIKYGPYTAVAAGAPAP